VARANGQLHPNFGQPATDRVLICMEAKQCTVTNGCKQIHRPDYRVWSEVFQAWLSSIEFVHALNSGAAAADTTSHLHAVELPPL
jgi:hypothetical protein